MSPNRSHELGHQFLQKMLRGFLAKIPPADRPIRALEIAIGDLNNAVVFREQDNIDLLVEIRDLNFVVAIENKIGAAESDGQLARYKQIVRAKYADWRHLFVFLTPDGTEANDTDYVSLSYLELTKIIDSLVENQGTPSETALILRHYVEMLRRHVVQDEQLRDLALQIYQRHKEAFDFVIECLPEAGGLLSVIKGLLENETNLLPDKHIKSILRFAPEEWSASPQLNSCSAEKWKVNAAYYLK